MRVGTKSAGGLGLLPDDVPQREKKRLIFRGPLLCCRRGGQALFLLSQGRPKQRKEKRAPHCGQPAAAAATPPLPGPEALAGARGTMWFALSLSRKERAGDAFGEPPPGPPRRLPLLRSLRLAFSSLTPRPH